MKLVAPVKLLPTATQAARLLATLRYANAACDWIAGEAWDHRVFRRFPLHKLVYRETRERFGLAAQVAVRAIAKVADAYKTGRAGQRRFHPLGAFPFDARLLTWNIEGRVVSIRTHECRELIPFAVSDRARGMLAGTRGEADLRLVDGAWYLLVACDVPTPAPKEAKAFLGVDLGIVNIATDSDGHVHGGADGQRAPASPPTPAPAAPSQGNARARSDCWPSDVGRSVTSHETSTTASQSRSSPRPNAPAAASPWKSWANPRPG